MALADIKDIGRPHLVCTVLIRTVKIGTRRSFTPTQPPCPPHTFLLTGAGGQMDNFHSELGEVAF